MKRFDEIHFISRFSAFLKANIRADRAVSKDAIRRLANVTQDFPGCKHEEKKEKKLRKDDVLTFCILFKAMTSPSAGSWNATI